MADETADSTVNVDDVTQNDLYMSPHEARVYDRYQQSNGYNNSDGDGTLNQNDYFPGYVPGGGGNYSGSIVGNIPLFGGGGALVPMGMYDARDLAIRKAALAKAKEVEDFRKSQSKAPVSKLVNTNDKRTADYIDFQNKSFDKALELSGGDPHKATYMLKNDPEYQKKTQAYHNDALMSDNIADFIAKTDQEQKEGKFFQTPKFKELRGRMLSALDSSSPEFKNQANIFRNMQMERDFSQAADEVAKRAFANEHGLAGIDTNDPDFIKVYNGTEKQWTPDQIEGFNKILIDNHYAGSDYMTPEKVKEMSKAFFSGKVSHPTVSVQQKHEDKFGSGKTINDVANPEEVGVINGAVVNDNGTTVPGNFTYSQYDGLTLDPIEAIIPVNAKGFNPNTGNLDKNIGNVKAKVGSVFNAIVSDVSGGKYNGVMVSNEHAGRFKSGQTKVVPMVAIQYDKKVKDEDGKEHNETHSSFVPLSSVKNSLIGPKGQNKEAIEEIERRANERNKTQVAAEKPVTTEKVTATTQKQDWSKYKRK
jgi:hypothetical protein